MTGANEGTNAARRAIRWKLSIIFYAIQLWLSHCFGRLEQRRIVITESHFNLEHCSLCNRKPISDLLNNLIFHIRRKHKNSLNDGNRENKYCSSREIHFICFPHFGARSRLAWKLFREHLERNISAIVTQSSSARTIARAPSLWIPNIDSKVGINFDFCVNL